MNAREVEEMTEAAMKKGVFFASNYWNSVPNALLSQILCIANSPLNSFAFKKRHSQPCALREKL